MQLFLNEQSLSLKLCNLQPTESRGVFKTMNLDLRQYGQLSTFVHAESGGTTDNLQNGDLNVINRYQQVILLPRIYSQLILQRAIVFE